MTAFLHSNTPRERAAAGRGGERGAGGRGYLLPLPAGHGHQPEGHPRAAEGQPDAPNSGGGEYPILPFPGNFIPLF